MRGKDILALAFVEHGLVVRPSRTGGNLAGIRRAHLALKPSDLERKVHSADRDSTVDGIYLRILVHANEHMGQLVAYARMTGIVPGWSKN